MARDVERMLGRLARDVSQLQKDAHQTFLLLQGRQRSRSLAKYQRDPVGYCRAILQVHLWERQEEILRSLLLPPYRTLVRSAHSVGKTFLSACAISWHYDCFPSGIVISTAPTREHVEDVLWAQIRILRQRAGLPSDFLPKAPYMGTGPDHYAKGITASSGEAFQGRHTPPLMFVFDEATAVAAIYWTTTNTMWKREPGYIWLAICNPVDTTSQAYVEDGALDADGRPTWHLFSMSALEHPNIAAELAGQKPPIPAAVTRVQVEDAVRDLCDPVTSTDRQSTDIEWPPGSSQWHRPSPMFQARWLGLWPQAGTYGVWSEALWQAACSTVLSEPFGAIPEMGCDVARYGDDDTEIHCRVAGISLTHEGHNGWGVDQVVGRLIERARELAAWANTHRDPYADPITPFEIPVKVDDDGVGGGVSDILRSQGYQVIMVNAGSTPHRPEDYPSRRSELWFTVAQRARRGELSLARLPRDVLQRLRVQAMAPVWGLDARGRRVVEKKDATKAKIGRSPDGMDAVNLSYAEVWQFAAPEALPDRPQRSREERGRQDRLRPSRR